MIDDLPEEVRTITADSKGRINLGIDFADEEVKVAVITNEEEKDIVDYLSEATGYFHDSEAAKLRDIAEASGQKPVGVVRAAVEDEIEDREWRVAHFESDGRDYHPHNPHEYFRIHKKMQKEFEAAVSELSFEDSVNGERPKEEFEIACNRLEKRARVHEAKADVAEQWLEQNGDDPEEVLMG